MSVFQLSAWIFSVMTMMAPIDRSSLPTVPGAKETPFERIDRYDAISKMAVQVSFDPNESPLPLTSKEMNQLNIRTDEQLRAFTALTLVSVALWESSYFRRDVDLGTGRLGFGDNGRSVCLMQINVGKGMTAEGWGAKELVEDRDKCFRAALHLLQDSWRSCGNVPMEQRASVYTSGTCRDGISESKHRISTAVYYWRRIDYKKSNI